MVSWERYRVLRPAWRWRLGTACEIPEYGIGVHALGMDNCLRHVCCCHVRVLSFDPATCSTICFVIGAQSSSASRSMAVSVPSYRTNMTSPAFGVEPVVTAPPASRPDAIVCRSSSVLRSKGIRQEQLGAADG